MSVEDIRDALAQVEQRIQTEAMIARIKNLFRPRIAFCLPDGPVLGEIRSRLVLFGPHQADLSVMGVNVPIRAGGFLQKSSSIQINGTTLLGISHRLFASRYIARDWEEKSYQLRWRGSLWKTRFELTEPVAGENLVRMNFAPLRWESSLFISPGAGMKAGVATGLAILLYYSWYLDLRFILLS